MILEDDPNDDGIAEAIAEATQEAELECILEIEEDNEGVLANFKHVIQNITGIWNQVSHRDMQTQSCEKLCKYTSM